MDKQQMLAIVQEIVEVREAAQEGGMVDDVLRLSEAVIDLSSIVQRLANELYAVDRSARIANDTASMLANGILPD